MNKNLKKIMVSTLISMTATSAIACANNNSKIAQKINNGVNDFVSSINKLDYVDTNKTSSNLGKIVSATNNANFYTKLAKNTDIENTITSPENRIDNFKLYVLSDSPFISLTSDDNSLNISMSFSTDKIENTSDTINENINKLILKRAILMVYVNEIYNGNVNLSEDNRKAINAYVNVIKENASFLNGNRGMVKNQLGLASNLLNEQSNNDMINYYIIKSGEALEIRSNKINSTISAIDSIISLLEQNLTTTSCYYQNNLSSVYENMLNKLESETDTSNENKKLAKEIAESINMINSNTNVNLNKGTNTNNENRLSNNNTNNITNTQNQNCINCPQTNTKLNPTTNSQQNNNSINDRTKITNNNQNTQNKHNSNYNYGITTLEEKTQDRPVFDRNQSNIIQNDINYKNLTPSQKARLKRERALNRDNNFNTNTEYPVNPTTRSKINNNTNQHIQNNFDRINSSSTNNINQNNAVRVPYKNIINND